MKAQEYANSFFDAVKRSRNDDEVTKAVHNILIEFMEEGRDLSIARKVETDSATIAILKEQSAKWRAFARIVNKKYGVFLIKTNGFKEYILSKLPVLTGKL